jgi:hypothetical protein
MNMYLTRVVLVLAATMLMLFGTLNAALAWTLSGTVYGSSNPLDSCSVTLTDVVTSAQVGTTTTNASGLYSFTVSDGSYNMTVTPQGGSGFSESVVNGIAVSGADVMQNVVLISRSFTVSGKVITPEGVGVSNIFIDVLEQVSGLEVTYLSTDADGNYSITEFTPI